MGMTRTTIPHDGIHLLQLEWSHALADPQLKVQLQKAQLARGHTKSHSGGVCGREERDESRHATCFL